MGYHTTPALITDNIELLGKIKAAIDRGESIKLSVPAGDNISYNQWRLRRTLAATDFHPEVMEGFFVGLGKSTTIRIETENSCLSVEPRVGKKGTKALNMELLTMTEDSVIAQLSKYEGSLLTVKFKPTPDYDEVAFVGSLQDIQWLAHLNTRTENDDGTISYVCEKVETKAGFGMLDVSQED